VHGPGEVDVTVAEQGEKPGHPDEELHLRPDPLVGEPGHPVQRVEVGVPIKPVSLGLRDED
jgi:hypothetical protein